MIVESQLKEWETSAKFKNNIMMDINPVIVLLLIDEVREQNKMIQYLANIIGNTANCTHSFVDCDKEKANAEDCIKCWITKARHEVTNGSLRDTLP